MSYRLSRSTSGWPPALDDVPFSHDSAAGRALQGALDRAHIDDDSPELSRQEIRSIKNQMLDAHHYTLENDGLHDRHLHAETKQSHNMVNHVFKNRDGKNVNIKSNLNHKKGKNAYTNKKVADDLFGGPGSGVDSSCACPLCTGVTPARTPACDCPLCIPVLGGGGGGGGGGAGISGDSSLRRLIGTGGDPFSGGGGGSSLAEPRTPRTIGDLMDLLRVHKPGKKIIEVAGDVDIVETKVTMLQLEPGVMGPGVLVLCAGGLPSQKSVLRNPLLNQDWAVGPAASGQQRLMLKITKKVHIHVHFVLKLAVPAF